MSQSTLAGSGSRPALDRPRSRRRGSLERLRSAARLRSRRARLVSWRELLERADAALGAEPVPAELARVLPGSGPAQVLFDSPQGSLAAARLLVLLARIRPDVVALAPDPEGESAGRGTWLRARFGPRGFFTGSVGCPKEALAEARSSGALVLLLPRLPRTLTSPRTVRWSRAVVGLVAGGEGPVVPVHLAATRLWIGGPRSRGPETPEAEPRATRFELRVGRPVARTRIGELAAEGSLLDHLRLKVYALRAGGRRRGWVATGRSLGRWLVRPRTVLAPVPPADPPEVLEAELAGLGADACLVEQGDLTVWITRGAAAPRLLREIGRLREISFRSVGEGTGRALDLDGFDGRYRHVVVWDRAARLVVGAYRLVGTDEVLAAEGMRGLYTHTLFHYGEEVLSAMGPALELGRSFVRAEYQRSYAPLLLLWRGIGAFLVRHPRYRHLFGAVSITNHYQPLSQALMVQYLETHNFCAELGRRVDPRRPFTARSAGRGTLRGAGAGLTSLDELSALISDIELDRKGVPVLLAKYLELGGRVLGFNVDPDFSDVLDALVVVDLDATEPRILRRYLGSDGLAQYLGSAPVRA